MSFFYVRGEKREKEEEPGLTLREFSGNFEEGSEGKLRYSRWKRKARFSKRNLSCSLKNTVMNLRYFLINLVIGDILCLEHCSESRSRGDSL